MQQIKRHVYRFNEIAIGDNLSALFYCLLNNVHYLSIDSNYLFDFETFSLEEAEIINKTFFIPIKKNILTLPDRTTIERGNFKAEVFYYLKLALGLSGLNLVPHKIDTVSFYCKNGIKVISNNMRRYKFLFNKITIFDDKNIYIPKLKIKSLLNNKQYKVIDSFDIKEGLNYNYFHTDEKFVNEIFVINNILYTVSYLAEEELQLSEYYIASARMQVAEVLNLDLANILPKDRAIINLKKNVYYEHDNYDFNNKTEEEIICQYHQQKIASFIPDTVILQDAFHWKILNAPTLYEKMTH